jgi:hypothetical protein
MKALLCTMFLILSIQPASSFFLFEPHLDYAMGSASQTNALLGAVDYEYSTLQFGGRAGIQSMGLMAGLDYSIAFHFLCISKLFGIPKVQA